MPLLLSTSSHSSLIIYISHFACWNILRFWGWGSQAPWLLGAPTACSDAVFLDSGVRQWQAQDANAEPGWRCYHRGNSACLLYTSDAADDM
eukprot:11648133-Alexandrium_andersonii.AAC.1